MRAKSGTSDRVVSCPPKPGCLRPLRPYTSFICIISNKQSSIFVDHDGIAMAMLSHLEWEYTNFRSRPRNTWFVVLPPLAESLLIGSRY